LNCKIGELKSLDFKFFIFLKKREQWRSVSLNCKIGELKSSRFSILHFLKETRAVAQRFIELQNRRIEKL